MVMVAGCPRKECMHDPNSIEKKRKEINGAKMVVRSVTAAVVCDNFFICCHSSPVCACLGSFRCARKLVGPAREPSARCTGCCRRACAGSTTENSRPRRSPLGAAATPTASSRAAPRIQHLLRIRDRCFGSLRFGPSCVKRRRSSHRFRRQLHRPRHDVNSAWILVRFLSFVVCEKG